MQAATNVTAVSASKASPTPGPVATANPKQVSALAVNPPVTATKDQPKSKKDTLELSSKGLRLAQMVAKDEKAPPPPPPPRNTSEDTKQVPQSSHESAWESEHKAKLERLETMVKQGLYKVDPFMLDQLAVRMAEYAI